MSLSEKYVVIKLEDWENTLTDLDEWSHPVMEKLEKLPIDGEHFVVREQDIFAPAGLYAYAGNIRTVLEVLDFAPIGFLDEDDRNRLLNLADDLTVTAGKWQAGETSKKIPD